MARGIHPSSKSSCSNQNCSARRGVGLALSSLAIPLYDYPSREDVQEGGRLLYENFIREEFEREGIRITDTPQLTAQYEAGDSNNIAGDGNAGIPRQTGRTVQGAEGDIVDNETASDGSTFRSALPSFFSAPEGYKNKVFTEYGTTLRELADEFSRSREGRKVKRCAEGVNLKDINAERFLELLVELFSSGLSRDRILALFYFCSVLLIRAVRENGIELCRHLFTWSVRYICEHVCQWVYEHGGWGKVLNDIYWFIFKIAAISLLVVGIGVGIVYIQKNR